MTEQMSVRLGLPYVQAAQAQKHVTVNEAFARLDALANLVLESVTLATPPAAIADGACYGVPGGAVGDWAGQEGLIAMAVNGGWEFAAPFRGLRAYVLDQGVSATFDGVAWSLGAVTVLGSGAGIQARSAESELVLGAGPGFDSDLIIPAGAMVLGATARVVDAIGGAASSWRLGTAGAEDRFGSGLGLAAGSWARGILSQPVTYWQPAPLRVEAEGGDFAAGRVRLAVHWLELSLPR